jgi:hypothetical protein
MSKNKNRQIPEAHSALDKMKPETSEEILGYTAAGRAVNAGQADDKSAEKMIADGEAEAENLGGATIDNKYNS